LLLARWRVPSTDYSSFDPSLHRIVSFTHADFGELSRAAASLIRCSRVQQNRSGLLEVRPLIALSPMFIAGSFSSFIPSRG
jgi:hypothetical protein